MKRIIFLIALATFASACHTTVPVSPGPQGRQSDEDYNSISVANLAPPAAGEVAAICDESSVVVEYQDSNAQVNDLRLRLNGIGKLRDKGRGEDGTRLVARLNRLDAEISSHYRSVTSSCRAFARCMQQNFFNEGKCHGTLSRWERSEREFSDLTRELREIDAEVEKIRILMQGSYSDDYVEPYPTVNRDKKCDCSSSVGGVFANCCQ